LRTVQGCGRVQCKLSELSRASLGDVQSVRAIFTRSGPNPETVSVVRLSRATISEGVRVRRRRAVAVCVPVLWRQCPKVRKHKPSQA
jgi:hypothetical protein